MSSETSTPKVMVTRERGHPKRPTSIIVRGIQVPFVELVIFFVKASVAAAFAAVITGVLWVLVATFISAFFITLGASLGS